MQNQVAGHFEKKIPDEKNSCRDGKLLAAEAQVLVHRQPGKAYIDAVDHRDHVKHKEERNQPDLQLPDRFALERFLGGARLVSQVPLFPSSPRQRFLCG